MDNVLSRVVTGLICLFIGGVLNGLVGFLLVYFTEVKPSPNHFGGRDYLGYVVFPLIGLVLGSLIGLAVGISQLKFPFSIVLGATVTFFLFVLFVVWMGGNDVNTTDGRKGFALVLIVLLLDGCFISLITEQSCQWWLKLFPNQNTDSGVYK